MSIGTITAIAEKARVSRGTLQAAFKREEDEGSHRIDQTTAEKLARATGKSVSWIIEGSEPVAPKAEDTLENARTVALLLLDTFEIDQRDAWLVLYDVHTTDRTVPGLFRAAAARLRSMNIPPRVEKKPPPEKPRNLSERR
jgi:hypothetical protein